PCAVPFFRRFDRGAHPGATPEAVSALPPGTGPTLAQCRHYGSHRWGDDLFVSVTSVSTAESGCRSPHRRAGVYAAAAHLRKDLQPICVGGLHGMVRARVEAF